jgi:hypothetical protein
MGEIESSPRTAAGRALNHLIGKGTMLSTGLNLAAAVSGLIAAWFWYQSATINAPSELRGSVGYGGPAIVDTGPLVAFAREVARLNKIAAGWTASAALLMALTTIAQPLVHLNMSGF